MSNQQLHSEQWQRELVAALRRQGLPRLYVARLVAELVDHAEDLCADPSLNPLTRESSMDAQRQIESHLGTAEQLAAAARSEFQRRTFAGRHPVLTFLAGPVVTMCGTFALIMLTLMAVGELLDKVTGGALSANDATNSPPSALEMGLMVTTNSLVRFAPFVLSAWLFVRLSRRSARHVWGVVACGIVAATALFFYSVLWAEPGGKGYWMMGFAWRTVGLDQLLQAAIPLALGGWLLWQSSVRGRRMLSA